MQEHPSQDPFATMLVLTDLATPYAVRAAVSLGLPSLVASGVESVDALAARSGANPGALRRLCAYLTAKGVFVEPAPGVLALTPVGRLLAGPRAATNLAEAEAGGHLNAAWPGLLHAVRAGAAGYPAVFGRKVWETFADDPGLAASFDRYMASWAEQWIPAVVKARDWSTAGHVVDVGGGAGRLLCALLDAAPGLQGTLVEMGGAAERGRDALARAGLLDRARVVDGSFFDPLPTGGDLYILAQVLHDWPDDDAARILKHTADAARPHGKVLLIERLVGSPPRLSHLRSDLFMLLLFGGAERSLDRFAMLADRAGLELAGTQEIGHDLSFIEMHPRKGNDHA